MSCVRDEFGHRDRYTQGRPCEDGVQIGVMIYQSRGARNCLQPPVPSAAPSSHQLPSAAPSSPQQLGRGLEHTVPQEEQTC